MKDLELLPQSLYDYFVEARANTFASGKEPIVGLNIPGFKGYRYHQKHSHYFYQDNYIDKEDHPGNFGGLEIVTSGSFRGDQLALYTYAGGLTEEGMDLGESVVYGRLVRFLSGNVRDARFGRNIGRNIKDELGSWGYSNEGKVDVWGWVDDEQISFDSKLVYKLRGTGVSFIPGF